MGTQEVLKPENSQRSLPIYGINIIPPFPIFLESIIRDISFGSFFGYTGCDHVTASANISTPSPRVKDPDLQAWPTHIFFGSVSVKKSFVIWLVE
ncbi:hypothetical protein AVEN_224388-1 [Araneus ventricosus]|uniref:Uncharacterized protein n=1 Tax=Araneus ventricosus TaxID=182803 RepID=A0A4Y2F8E7_ARAVE|nr:hypothetical protein AVEN_224388-1 [Araneus ventricosus]